MNSPKAKYGTTQTTAAQRRAIKAWQKLFEGDQMNAKSALSRCEEETGDGLYAVARDLLEAFES